MLRQVKDIDERVVDQLFGVYEESMADLAGGFASPGEMRASYREYLEEFVSTPGQFVLVEERDGVWASALRAVPFGEGRWFIEAVETAPTMRKQGCGHELLAHVLAFLRDKGADELCCIIAPENTASRRLHEGCGFVATDDAPVNPWEELEEGCILYRCAIMGAYRHVGREWLAGRF